jgi:hypothetical protein
LMYWRNFNPIVHAAWTHSMQPIIFN